MRSNRKIHSKNCVEACTEWDYNAIGGDNFLHKSSQQSKTLTPMYENERRIMKPTGCLPLAPTAESPRLKHINQWRL
jgi:hypothetical protein